ncbi:MAG: hypothetical protein DIU71_07995 [Proteobacteria bacterium]|nr:MAG: hypothetical protein DIU71_07995 [Pseudomonadota bacterium]
MTDLLDLLQCPRCQAAPLAQAGETFACTACAAQFPRVEDIPWLFAEPGAAASEWRLRLEFLLQHLGAEAARMRAELDKPHLKPLTRTRLKLLAAAYQDQARRLQALLAPLVREVHTARETHLALRTRLPQSQGLAAYYANIHRDWAWGAEENAASCAEVEAALGERPPGRTLILGAGAGRLAYDIHLRCAPRVTVAADINPLLLLVARKVLAGEKLALYEFPIAPRSAEAHAVLRTLSAERPVGERFHLVFADALHAPFAAEAFDTVITPWFIDIIAEDFARFAPRVNRWLRPGGRWVNFGSLAFAQADAAACYSLEEVEELVSDAGFALGHRREASLPYMRSPASRHARVESVVTFAADKVRQVAAPPAFEALPEWITLGTEPVPLTPAFQATALSTRIHGFIMSLIDGRRSLRDMAAIMVEQRLMTAEDAETALRGFFIKMYEDSRRRMDY